MSINLREYVKLNNEILTELNNDLGLSSKDVMITARILKSVLHALRYHLTIEKSFQLLDQLPLVIKMLYVDDWDISRSGKPLQSLKELIHEIIQSDSPMSHYDFGSAKDMDNAIIAVFKVLRRHISLIELEDIKSVMPDDVECLWNFSV